MPTNVTFRTGSSAGRQSSQDAQRDIKPHHIKQMLLRSAVYFGIPLAIATTVLSFGPDSSSLASGSSEVEISLKGKNHA